MKALTYAVEKIEGFSRLGFHGSPDLRNDLPTHAFSSINLCRWWPIRETISFYFIIFLYIILVEPPDLRCIFATPLFGNSCYYSYIVKFWSGLVAVVKIPWQNLEGGVQHISGRIGFDRGGFVFEENLEFPTTTPVVFTVAKAGEEQWASCKESSLIVTHIIRVRSE